MWKQLGFALALIAGSSASAGEAPRVRFNALGPYTVGLSEREVARIARSPVVHVDRVAEEEGCFYGSVRGLPDGAAMMFLDGTLARIDVTQSGIRTWSGAEVGMTEAEVQRLYGGRLQQEPHAYTGPEGHYLTLRSSDGRYGLRFETDGKRVTGYYSGTSEAVGYIEGCQ